MVREARLNKPNARIRVRTDLSYRSYTLDARARSSRARFHTDFHTKLRMVKFDAREPRDARGAAAGNFLLRAKSLSVSRRVCSIAAIRHTWHTREKILLRVRRPR